MSYFDYDDMGVRWLPFLSVCMRMIILYRLDEGTLGLMTLPRLTGAGEGNQMVVGANRIQTHEATIAKVRFITLYRVV